jgi:DNA-binding NtrC family response regulator
METVLLVDDDSGVLQFLGWVLAKAGFHTRQALSGEEALELMALRPFDAVLVDKNLRGMDGVEVLRHVRRRQPTCACILMTGAPSMTSAIEALRLGVHDYVMKPSPELDRIGERLKAAIEAARLNGETEVMRRRLEEQEQKLARSTLELAMNSELVESRVQERVDELTRSQLERDLRLADSARGLLERAQKLKQKELANQVESHLAMLKACTS